MIRPLPHPDIDTESREQLLAENPSGFSAVDIAKMIRDGEDGFNESDFRDSFEELVEGSYRIDPRAEGEGFGKSLDQELIIVCKIPQTFKLTANCAVVQSRRAECSEREFEATRLETDDPDYVFFSVRLIGG